jgi:hypothetical protein
MAFPAREVTPRLINGKVVFRTGQVNRRDAPERTIIGPFQSDFAGQGLALVNLDKAASLRITLLNQIALHQQNSIIACPSLARIISPVI